MKKILALVLALVMVLSLAACGGTTTTETTAAPVEGGDTASTTAAAAAGVDGEVAIFWYTFGDTYLSSVRAAMDAAWEAAGIKYQDYDANNSQTTQTEQIQTAITKGAAVLVVNIVDASSDDATQAIVEMAQAANIPLVFFNRSVSEEIVSAYENAAYVGTDYTQAGHMQGEMIGNYVLENYETLDLNGDGQISYVMFKGQEGNAEAEARTQYAVEDADALLTAAGKPALSYYDAAASTKYLVDTTGNSLEESLGVLLDTIKERLRA